MLILKPVAKVVVLNGAPYSNGVDSSHPPWTPVIYVAGPTPFAGLEAIRLVMQEKVRQYLLPQLPPSMLVDWALGMPPEQPLPLPWRVVENHSAMWDLDPFSVQPPEAPHSREHVTGFFQRTPGAEVPRYRLVLETSPCTTPQALHPLKWVI